MNEHKLLVERNLTSKEQFHGKLLHVFLDEIRLPSGGESTREWIKHPGACAVVPVFDNGDLMMLRQFRYPPHQIFWEVPAGKIDKGELEEKTAKRELEEEAGLVTGNFAYVGHFYPAIGYSDEIIHIYAAWNLSSTNQNVDEDEFVTKEKLPFKKAIDMIHSGEINDGKSIVCLLRVWKWWKKNGPFDVA